MHLRNREYAVAVARREGRDPRKQSFHVIRNGLNYWVADPFPIEVCGELYIFGEMFIYSKRKGSLGYTKYSDGKFSPWKVVIEEDYHLSFPYLFYKDNVLYMCPEAHESKQLYFYRCVDFPEKWVKEKPIHVYGCFENFNDTIFWDREGVVYGITCDWKDNTEHEMRIFKLEDGKCIFSGKKPDTLPFYLTRPAGKIFYDTKLSKDIMVSQICQPQYGSGLIFKEFELAWPHYSERELYRVWPTEIQCDKKRRYVGIHTCNYTESYMVIDLIWERFSTVEAPFRLLAKAGQLLKRNK